MSKPMLLYAVDAKDTKIREDCFLLQEKPEEGIVSRLIIASVLPPRESCITLENLVEGIEVPTTISHTKRFLCREDSIESALSTRFPQEVLYTTHTLTEDGEVNHELSVGRAITTQFTYNDFIDFPLFVKIKSGVEQFFRKEEHLWYLYQNTDALFPLGTEDKDNKARILIAGIINLFNRTCSAFMNSRSLPTLKRNSDSLRFGYGSVGWQTKFSSPLRSGLGFINIQNLYAALCHELEGDSENTLEASRLPFSREKLLSYGVQLYPA